MDLPPIVVEDNGPLFFLDLDLDMDVMVSFICSKRESISVRYSNHDETSYTLFVLATTVLDVESTLVEKVSSCCRRTG